jgi:nucleoside-diphosphate-sugar epimerase
MQNILVTGALGQIGTELTQELRRKYGRENVLATGLQPASDSAVQSDGPYAALDVTDCRAVAEIIQRHRIDVVYHLASILSGVGEKSPETAWNVNMNGLHNVLECARLHGVSRIFWPSSIAVFGPEAPKDQTPQETVMRPTTIYGVTKVSGELLCDYYVHHYGLDVRGVRYPGVISHGAPPGGGTTDYAVAMFYAAVTSRRYTCFVREDTVLPMIYMPDGIRAALELMEADAERLRHHNAFNLAGLSFSAGELVAEIRKHVPEFECEFVPDYRQTIADSWPRSIDDAAARNEWNWQPEYDLATLTADMLKNLRRRQAAGEPVDR